MTIYPFQLPYKISEDMAVISKADYERCVLRGLITNAPTIQTSVKGKPIEVKNERLYVKNTEFFPGHPETGGSTTNGVCPHCGRCIQQRDYNEESCDYCGGLIKWSRFW